MSTGGNFPSSHTTTTTTTTTRVMIAPCHFDPSYFRTIPGILKIVQMVLDFIGFICILASDHYGNWATFFNVVAIFGLLLTGILLAFYLFHLIERMYMLPWLLLEFIYCAVWVLFFLIASSLLASKAAYVKSWGAAAFFGFAAMIAYGYDAFLKFQGWRAGDIAQGERHVSSSTTTSPTAY